MGAEIIHKERKYHADGMLWRFLTAGDPEAEIVLVRDVDTRFGLRDKQANDAWLASGKDFHIIRDHKDHEREIMGGLWACRGETIPDMEQLIANWKQKFVPDDDQDFLVVKIYTRIRARAYIQTDINVFRGEEVHPCPPFVAEPGRAICMGGGIHFSAEEIAEHDAIRQAFRRSGRYRMPYCTRVRSMVKYLLRALLFQRGKRFIDRFLCNRLVRRLCNWIGWLLFWVNRPLK